MSSPSSAFNVRPFFLLIVLIPFFLISCEGVEYVSKRQGEGVKLLVAKDYPAAIESFEKAVQDASNQGDIRDLIHLKSLLGWTWSESGNHTKGEKILIEAVKLGDDNKMLLPLYRARLAVVASKSGNYRLGITAGEKALEQEAQRWKEVAQLDNQEEIIDYAVANHGLPPDVDMIRVVTMSETALSVMYLIMGEEEKSKQYGETLLKHTELLTSIMKMAPEKDMQDFYQGIAVGAAAASRANQALGNDEASATYKQKSIDAFNIAGIEVDEGNLLAAYMKSAVKPLIQSTPQSDETDLIKQAEQLYSIGKFGKARDLFKQAYVEAAQSRNNEKMANVAEKLGWLLAELGKYPQAIRLLKESVQREPKKNVVSVRYAKLAAIESRLGNHLKAEEYVKSAFDTLYLHRKKMFRGKDLDSLIDAAMKDPGLPPDVVLMKAVTAAEGARTTLRYFRGDYLGATVEGKRAVRHFKDIELATSYAPRHEQLSYYEGAAFSALVTGDSYLKTGDIHEGQKYLSLAQTYFKKADLDYGDVIAEGLLGYASILQGDYVRGGKAFTKTLQRINEGGYEELKWHVLSVMGSYLFSEAREVETKLEKLINADLFDWQKTAKKMAEEKRQKSQVLEVIFHERTGNDFLPLIDELKQAKTIKDIRQTMQLIAKFLKELSYDNYLAAIDNLESIRSNLETDLNKRAYLANKESIYSDFIELSTELYGAAKGFEALERFKAKSLVDLLASREVAYRNGDLIKELATIQASFGEEALAMKKGAKTDSYANTVKEAVKGYRSVIVKLRKKEPELASLVSAKALSVKELQRLLPKGLALIEYFITEKETYIWTVKKNDISVTVTKTGKETIQKQVQNLRKAILGKKPSLNNLSQELYSLLLKPVAGELATEKHLLIVPYDALHHLPFNALHTGKGYLIEDYPLTVSSSASVLEYVLKKRTKRAKTLFAMGNPDLGNSAYDLPFAEKEVRTISSFFPNAQMHLRLDASEGKVKKKSKKYGVLHFASHAEFNALSPLSSSILLARDSTDDGHLEAREVFSLDLNASLVTLSACQTGLGQITKGDEIIGMSRAFIYAGAPSILASLWSVSDESTAQLMEVFYRNLQKEDKDVSLRNAQLTLIHSKNFNHPFYWAPFYLSGDWK